MTGEGRPGGTATGEGRPGSLGLWSGVGLAAANMIGAGVLLSAGYMAQEMSPGWILVDWLVGMALAMAGARAYAEMAVMLPRSGGEYRYLSDLAHPLLGYLSGWASLLVGFSAPIAINAVASADFLATVVPLPDERVIATGLILILTAFHSAGLVTSKWTQDLLVVFKILLLVAFIAVGVALGESSWPSWTPPRGPAGFSSGPFLGSLFWIAFAFTGWNAAAYAAGEFRRPARDVPRAMLIGCAMVGVLYLLVNWVFVANLTPRDALAVVETNRPVLGHAVMQKLLGDTGAAMMSVLVALALFSTMSAMVMVGPRVYATMAEDGFLPRFLAARAGRPPVGSVLFQSAVAVAIVWTHSLVNALGNVGAVLVLYSALAAGSLLLARRRRPDLPRPRPVALVAAAVYTAASAWILVFGVRRLDRSVGVWAACITALAVVAYLVTERARRRGR
jgi:APA family basic amino acid/polyamine antiporter